MAVTNKDFHAAMRNKKDEFYTQLSDIEKEMRHYTDFFKGKIVFVCVKYLLASQSMQKSRIKLRLVPFLHYKV